MNYGYTIYSTPFYTFPIISEMNNYDVFQFRQ